MYQPITKHTYNSLPVTIENCHLLLAEEIGFTPELHSYMHSRHSCSHRMDIIIWRNLVLTVDQNSNIWMDKQMPAPFNIDEIVILTNQYEIEPSSIDFYELLQNVNILLFT